MTPEGEGSALTVSVHWARMAPPADPPPPASKVLLRARISPQLEILGGGGFDRPLNRNAAPSWVWLRRWTVGPPWPVRWKDRYS